MEENLNEENVQLETTTETTGVNNEVAVNQDFDTECNEEIINDNVEEILPNPISEISNTEIRIEEISEFISSIKSEVDVRNERDKYKDEAIQRMSKQIASFEKGVFETIKKELIFEVISFYDLLLKFQEKFQTLENKEFQNEVDFLETELSNILFNNSIDEIDENMGIEVDRDLHRIKQIIETNNLDDNQKIIKILKKGFIWNEKIIRKQEVIIAEYKESTNE